RITAEIRFTAETQRTPRLRREKQETSLFPSLRFLRVLCASAVEKNSAVERNRYLSSASYKACRSLLLFVLTLCSCFAPLAAKAQTGMITGRVVSEDGGGLPNVTVFLAPIAADRRPTSGGIQNRTATDEDGNFKFTGLAPRVYSVSAFPVKGYVPRPIPVYERQ